MRIIGGQNRGRKLRSPKGDLVRPTSDRLRETLFDILGPSVEGADFLDLFAGTGAVGLEAISRGARSAVLVESSRPACSLIRANAALCSALQACRVLQQDLFRALRELAREGYRAQVIFADPPYGWGPYQEILELLFTRGLAPEGSQVIIEHHRRTSLPDAGALYLRRRVVRQGDTCLSFYTRRGEGEPQPA